MRTTFKVLLVALALGLIGYFGFGSVKDIKEEPLANESFLSLRIAIIGAGPGGLTLARLLQRRGFKFVTVYENEVSSTARGHQGGTLELHDEYGQKTLKQAGLFQEFQNLCRNEGQDLKIYNKNGKALYNETGNSDNNDRPEIDRKQLRQLLVNSLLPNSIQWGHSLSSLTLNNSDPTSPVQLFFKNFSNPISVDLVIGADGAWSKVRKTVSEAQPIPSGLSFVEISIHNPNPEVSDFVGRGSLFAVAPGKAIIIQTIGDGSLRTYATLPDDIAKTTNLTNQNDIQKSLREHFSDWDSSLTRFLESPDPSNDYGFFFRSISTLPSNHSWKSNGRVTLLGDAAHLMPPVGEGVNLAMEDASSLVMSLLKSSDLPTAILKYEKELFKRSRWVAKESEKTFWMLLDENAPYGFVEQMEAFHSIWSIGPLFLRMAFDGFTASVSDFLEDFLG